MQGHVKVIFLLAAGFSYKHAAKFMLKNDTLKLDIMHKKKG